MSSICDWHQNTRFPSRDRPPSDFAQIEQVAEAKNAATRLTNQLPSNCGKRRRRHSFADAARLAAITIGVLGVLGKCLSSNQEPTCTALSWRHNAQSQTTPPEPGHRRSFPKPLDDNKMALSSISFVMCQACTIPS
jgi:hypothetical protein